MEFPDVSAVYEKLQSLETTIKGHDNHLGTLQTTADLTITFLKVLAGVMGVNIALVAAVIVLALR